MTTTDDTRPFRERAGELADAYWQARVAHEDERAADLLREFLRVPGDHVPELEHLGPWNAEGEGRFSGYYGDDAVVLDDELPEGWRRVVELDPFACAWRNEAGVTLDYCEGSLYLVVPAPIGGGPRAIAERQR